MIRWPSTRRTLAHQTLVAASLSTQLLPNETIMRQRKPSDYTTLRTYYCVMGRINCQLVGGQQLIHLILAEICKFLHWNHQSNIWALENRYFKCHRYSKEMPSSSLCWSRRSVDVARSPHWQTIKDDGYTIHKRWPNDWSISLPTAWNDDSPPAGHCVFGRPGWSVATYK